MTLIQVLKTAPEFRSGHGRFHQLWFVLLHFAQSFRIVPVNGVSASLETVESGAYPLSKISYLYVDRQQMQTQLPTSAAVNFYLTYLNDTISEVSLLPLTSAQLNASKTQWLNIMGLGQTTDTLN